MLKKSLWISAMVIILLSLVISPTISKNETKAKSADVSTLETKIQTPINTDQNVIVDAVVAKEDDRAEKLAAYFATKNSPFVGVARDFIAIADKYSIDWTLLPAIAGLESSFGLHVPAYSYNPYGWNNGKYSFKSWSQATEVVASALRTRYVPVGEITAFRIGPTYAASPTWAERVSAYQREINRFASQ